MNRHILTGLAIGLAAGLVIGYFLGAAHLTDSAPATPAPSAGGTSAANAFQTQQRILAEEAALANDPKNLQGWVNLGNDYFDLHQSQKAVQAYDKALALAPDQPGAPDILTDEGVMYRELGQFDKAIQNFKAALKLNPKHLQSLYNLGIIYAQDKGDPENARQVWQKVLEIAPASPQADLARKALAALKGPALP